MRCVTAQVFVSTAIGAVIGILVAMLERTYQRRRATRRRF